MRNAGSKLSITPPQLKFTDAYKKTCMPKNACFWPQMPKYGNSAPISQTIENAIFFTNEIVLPLCSQRDVPKNVCLAPKCPNMIIRPQTPKKMKILKNLRSLNKYLATTLPTSPQSLSGDHFKPRYT